MKKTNNKGITLIALVVTIIVLLILAGVSIAMLTVQNGILTQAQKAKTTTEDKSAEEKIKLAVMAARAQSEGALDADKLVTEITNNYGGTATKTGTGFPVNTTVDGKSFTVDGNGNVTSTGSGNGSTERKLLSEITVNETANTQAKDNLGNPITIPAGFEVVNPTDNVTDGIIIKDKTHTATAGSEFVWIPVGTIKTDNNGGTKPIKLSRYTFDETTGAPTDQGDAAINEGNYNFQELASSDKGNTVAKDIEAFKEKANASHGYYLARYEARDKDTTTARTSYTSDTNQVVCTPDNYVYNYVTQIQAADLSRKMYKDSNFESDLVNSYAWDTAIVFLQTFGDNNNYANKASVNSSLASTGTNNSTTKDTICNIYDMASNCFEWSTETCSSSSGPCVTRGGTYFASTGNTSRRGGPGYSSVSDSFRPLLYL